MCCQPKPSVLPDERVHHTTLLAIFNVSMVSKNDYFELILFCSTCPTMGEDIMDFDVKVRVHKCLFLYIYEEPFLVNSQWPNGLITRPALLNIGYCSWYQHLFSQALLIEKPC